MKAAFPTGTQVKPGQPEPASFVPPKPEELAAHFPELEILELIGRGGMGMVYKARQKRLDRLVALKILPPSVSHSPAFAERFAREAKALAHLSHPNIVTVHDFGQTDGLFYFVMEFVDGVNLRQLLNSAKITPKEALAIVPQICDGLQYAHDKGVVHRDIKPENILLSKDGTVKIADFGLAKLMGYESQDLAITSAVDVMGTPHYMAPEQVEHPQEVDHRADIYSVGVVFYQMLTGELPIGLFAPPSRKVQIDVRLDEIVLRALEKEPERRYQQASVLKTEIETIAATPPTKPPVVSASSVPPDFGRRQPTAQPTETKLPLTPGSTPPTAPGAKIIAPAIALLATGALKLSSTLKVLFGVASPLLDQLEEITGIHIAPAWQWFIEVFVVVVMLLPALSVILGSAKMIRLRSYAWSIAAAILAMVCPPLRIIGLPIGIWALVVLAHGDVRGAFAAARSQPSKANTWPWLLGSIALPTALVVLALNLSSGKLNVTVTGVVTDAATRQLIAGARVSDDRSGAGANNVPHETVTDASGRYELRTWNKSHTIAASAPGYETRLGSLGAEPPWGQRKLLMDFQLQPTNSGLAAASTELHPKDEAPGSLDQLYAYWTDFLNGSTAKDSVREEFNRTLPLAPNGRLSLDNVNGPIEISGWDRDEVVIRAVKHGDTKESVEAVQIEVEAQPSHVTIHTRQPEKRSWSWGRNDRVSVDYTIQVPNRAYLHTIENANGRIVIEGVDGDIEATTANGVIHTKSAAGNLKLSTANGRIAAELASLGDHQSVSLETANGQIVATLPEGADAEISASTVNGRITSEFPSLVVKKEFPLGSSLTGVLGNGSAHLKIGTANGRIDIRRSETTKSEQPNPKDE
jgi:serine/threonine protein kinase